MLCHARLMGTCSRYRPLGESKLGLALCVLAENYYDILGVEFDADEDEIRTAYRRRAKELHPDVNKEVREAVLATAPCQTPVMCFSGAKFVCLHTLCMPWKYCSHVRLIACRVCRMMQMRLSSSWGVLMRRSVTQTRGAHMTQRTASEGLTFSEM